MSLNTLQEAQEYYEKWFGLKAKLEHVYKDTAELDFYSPTGLFLFTIDLYKTESWTFSGVGSCCMKDTWKKLNQELES